MPSTLTTSIPLCIDLDGTLIKADAFVKGALLYLGKNPLRIIKLLIWLKDGKAHLKQQLFQRISIDPKTLPYHLTLLAWIKEEKKKGRQILLVTGSNHKVARSIAEYLNIFDDVLASDDKINLTGHAKKEALNLRFGVKHYDYAGNSRADLAVWQDARKAIVVNPSMFLFQRYKRLDNLDRILL